MLNARSQFDGGGNRVAALEEEIDNLRQARRVIFDEIEKGFPDYAELTRPHPKAVSAVKTALKADEALLAYCLGDQYAFVWSISGKGRAGFAMLPLSSADISQRVESIRKSLTPNGHELKDLPQFDVLAAQQLYQGLLEPLQKIWKGAKHLIIVPHGPLGHLPFGLLVTSPKIHKSIPEMPLDRYRRVPWLIRERSITVLPACGSLLTLKPRNCQTAGFWFSLPTALCQATWTACDSQRLRSPRQK